ncbi:MAG: DUF3822 family protein [Flavobacteriaceae bacterium]|nr:DUF3822 family protein [Flavobacteriaceae bacterium]
MVKKKIQTINKHIDHSYLKDSHLSIQLSLDGFSFCIINKNTNEVHTIGHHPFSDQSPTPQKHLENVMQLFETEKLLQHKFDSVNITHVNDLSALVPKPLFDPENIQNYIKYTSKTYQNDYIVYDEIDNHDMVNVYIPFVNLNNFFLEKFGSFEYKHTSTVLIENLLNTYKFSEHPHMFVNIADQHFEMVVIANNQLLFYNAFKYQTKEDFIYYVLFTSEQLGLNTENFEFILAGNIDKESELYKIAYKYIRKVSLIENRSKYHFSADFNDATKRHYFTLLNQY